MTAFMDNLRQLFADCDTDQNGSLGREEFGELCAKIGLNKEAADETFARLDIDRDERITFDEFAAGFNQYQSKQKCTPSPSHSPSAAKSRSPVPARFQQHPPPQTELKSGKLSPSGVGVGARGRKSASPLGVMSLGSTGSSTSNLGPHGGRSTSTGTTDLNSADFATSADLCYPSNNGNNEPNVIVYSSDMIPDYEAGGGGQAGGSGQFGSLMSSQGSFSQLRNMQDLLECVQKLQSENQQLSQIFFKDKREREEYISQLGEEFDQQVREVEERANRRAREELESEKKRLREMMLAEREQLQHHYQTIEKMSKLIKSGKATEREEGESIDKVRSKLEDTYLENRQLKRSLLDTKTDVALIWKEMEKLKKQYEDKLSSAYERNNETRNECDHIKQQLSLMKDSNRKLQDASDVITTYITDKVEPVIKSATEGPNSLDSSHLNYLNVHEPGQMNRAVSGGAISQAGSRRGSILSEYLMNGAQPGEEESDVSLDAVGGCNNSTNGDIESLGSSTRGSHLTKAANKLRNPQQQQQQEDTTLQKTSSSPKVHTQDNHHQQQPPRPLPRAAPIPPRPASQQLDSSSSETNQQLHHLKEEHLKKSTSTPQKLNETNQQQQQRERTEQPGKSISGNHTTIEKPALNKTQQANSNKSNSNSNNNNSIRSIGRHFFIGSRAQSDSQADSSVETTKLASDASSKAALTSNNKSISVDQANEPQVEPSDGPSKFTFNIILVGDSFVGKSSFAARFMEGNFVQGLISNCSIDFKTKAYKVDGVNYTINLWDTAGQERFRSITASYFRKADGIILMYDVTDKRSYLNVRNWMSTISDTAAENVAVLLVGNKIDLRQSHNKDKCVPAEEGFRLAKEYDIVFLETSVKTGTNLVPSMGKLIRLIAKNNTPVEEDHDRIKLNDKNKMFNCMPKNC